MSWNLALRYKTLSAFALPQSTIGAVSKIAYPYGSFFERLGSPAPDITKVTPLLGRVVYSYGKIEGRKTIGIKEGFRRSRRKDMGE